VDDVSAAARRGAQFVTESSNKQLDAWPSLPLQLDVLATSK